MGRTNPTYRDFLQAYEEEFSDYRRALRRQHQPAFEQLFDGARQFADAAGYTNHLDRDTLVLVSICHAQQLRIAELDERLDDLEAQLDEK